LGEELDFSKIRNKVIIIFYASLGLIVPIFGGKPVLVMVASQAFTLTVTPLVIILTLILLNRKSIMGEHKIGIGMNFILSLIALFTIIMSVIGAVALIGLF
jgi:manganese transport protein